MTEQLETQKEERKYRRGDEVIYIEPHSHIITWCVITGISRFSINRIRYSSYRIAHNRKWVNMKDVDRYDGGVLINDATNHPLSCAEFEKISAHEGTLEVIWLKL